MDRKIEIKKERDFGQKFNVTIEFIRQEFKPIMKGIIYISGPFIVLASLMGAYYQRNSISLLSFSIENPDLLTDDFWISAVALILFSILAYIFIFAVVNEYVKRYQDSQKSLEINALWEGVKSALPGYFMSTLGYSGLLFFASLIAGFVFAGFFAINIFIINMFLVMGLFIGVFFSFVLLYLTFVTYNTEHAGLFGSIRRTLSLLKGDWWSSLGLFIVSWLMVSIVSMVFSIPNLILTSVGVWHSIQDEEAIVLNFSEELLYAFTSFVSSAGSFFMSIIIMLIMIFQYYNLVEKSDASGLLERIQSMGKGPREDEDEDY